MPGKGRIEGRVNGGAYELVQGGAVRQTIPLAQAHADEKFKRAITQNSWQELPA